MVDSGSSDGFRRVLVFSQATFALCCLGSVVIAGIKPSDVTNQLSDENFQRDRGWARREKTVSCRSVNPTLLLLLLLEFFSGSTIASGSIARRQRFVSFRPSVGRVAGKAEVVDRSDFVLFMG